MPTLDSEKPQREELELALEVESNTTTLNFAEHESPLKGQDGLGLEDMYVELVPEWWTAKYLPMSLLECLPPHRPSEVLTDTVD